MSNSTRILLILSIALLLVGCKQEVVSSDTKTVLGIGSSGGGYVIHSQGKYLWLTRCGQANDVDLPTANQAIVSESKPCEYDERFALSLPLFKRLHMIRLVESGNSFADAENTVTSLTSRSQIHPGNQDRHNILSDGDFQAIWKTFMQSKPMHIQDARIKTADDCIAMTEANERQMFWNEGSDNAQKVCWGSSTDKLPALPTEQPTTTSSVAPDSIQSAITQINLVFYKQVGVLNEERCKSNAEVRKTSSPSYIFYFAWVWRHNSCYMTDQPGWAWARSAGVGGKYLPFRYSGSVHSCREYRPYVYDDGSCFAFLPGAGG